MEITVAYDDLHHFAEVEGRLSLLESLTFHCTDVPDDVLESSMDLIRGFSTAGCFQHAPRLKYLQLFGQLQDLRAFKFPLHSLTKVTLMDVSLDAEELVDLLKKCCYLEHLDWIRLFKHNDDFEDAELSEHSLHHASLRSLSMTVLVMDAEPFGAIGRWSLPNLREICLEIVPSHSSRRWAEGHESVYEWTMRDGFTKLLVGLISPLQLLSIKCEDDPCFCEGDLLECLIASPSLVELHLHDLAAFALTSRILGSLTFSDDESEPHIPSLQVLKVDWIPGVFPDKAFARMVESRQVHTKPLHTLPSTASQLRSIDIRVLEREWEDDEDDDFDPGEDEDTDCEEAPIQFNLSMISKTVKVFRKYEAHGLRLSVREEDEFGGSKYVDL